MAVDFDERKIARKSRGKGKKSCEFLPWVRKNGFLLLLLLATVSGYVLGLLLKSQNLSNHTIHLIGFPGQLVLRAFLMVIVPLLFCSLVLGFSSIRKDGDAKMVAITIAFFLALSSFAAIMGATAGHLVHPGQKISSGTIQTTTSFQGRKGVILDSMLDLLWNAIPSNLIEATFTQEYTHVELYNTSDEHNDINSESLLVYKKSIRKKNGVNFMGLLSFSILFGCALASLGDKGEALLQVIQQLNAVVMKIMIYFLRLLPIGMFFWMFKEGLVSIAPVQILKYMGVFLGTAMGCVVFHQFVLLPALYLVIVRKNPITYHLNLLPAILTAFGTASSAATLPATVRCAEEANRVNRSVSQFVLPLGMVVHMNGGTFYLTLSTIFLAQLEGVSLGAAETIMAGITAVLLCIAAPGTASAGNPVYYLTVMAAAGISKPQYLSLVLSMEWLMERFRTVMNVVADSYVAAFVEKLCLMRLLLDTENVEYATNVIDCYDPHISINKDIELSSTTYNQAICKCCGNRMDIS